MKKKFILIMLVLLTLTACANNEKKFTKDDIKNWNVAKAIEPKEDDINDSFVNGLKDFIKENLEKRNYEAFSEMVCEEYLQAVDLTRDAYRDLNKETQEALKNVNIKISDVEAKQVDDDAIEFRYTITFNDKSSVQYIYIYKDKDGFFKFSPSMYEPITKIATNVERDTLNINFISIGKVTDGMELRARIFNTDKWDREVLSATLYTDRGKYDAAKFKLNVASQKKENVLFYFEHAKGKLEKFELVYKADKGEKKTLSYNFK